MKLEVKINLTNFLLLKLKIFRRRKAGILFKCKTRLLKVKRLSESECRREISIKELNIVEFL